MALGSGSEIAGRYRLATPLGEGGMGAVWRADHLTLGSPVAIKLIDTSLVDSPEALNRFMREAQAAAALRSPHVVQIFDYGVEDGVPYIAMEVLDGEDLGSRLERVGVLSAEATARVITHVARAMTKAHELGIVHRDLKPDNIFIVFNEDEEIAKVLDFGVAKATDVGLGSGKDATTRTGAVIGTPQYMSPEQARGDRTVDWRSDLWALAVIAYECLVGVRPFEADGVGALLLKICTEDVPVPSSVAKVPEGFDAWFARATQRDPEKRFQSAREMTSALRAVLLGEQAAGPDSGPAASMGPVRIPSASATGAAARARSGPTTTEMSATAMAPRSGAGRRSSTLLLAGAFVVAAAGGVAWLARGADEGATLDESPSAASGDAPATLSAPVATAQSALTAAAPEDDEPEVEPTVEPSAVPEPPPATPPAEKPAARFARVVRKVPPAPSPAPEIRPAPAPAPAPKRVRDIGF